MKSELQIKPERTRWLTGVAAVATATGAANAAIVQIDLINNQVNTNSDTFNSDFTGDGIAGDGGGMHPYSNPFTSRTGAQIGFTAIALVRATYNPGNTANRRYHVRGVTATGIDPSFLSRTFQGPNSYGAAPQNLNILTPIGFSDASYNSGNYTRGWVEMNIFNTSSTEHTIELTRIIFDDASTTRPTADVNTSYQLLGSTENGVFTPVPEPSSLGLLALGAGGILARRRRKQA